MVRLNYYLRITLMKISTRKKTFLFFRSHTHIYRSYRFPIFVASQNSAGAFYAGCVDWRCIHERVRDSSRRFEREHEPFLARPSESESVLNRVAFRAFRYLLASLLTRLIITPVLSSRPGVTGPVGVARIAMTSIIIP